MPDVILMVHKSVGLLYDEDSGLNTSDSVFGHHGTKVGRPGMADYSHNTSSSNSPVNCRGRVHTQQGLVLHPVNDKHKHKYVQYNNRFKNKN